MPSLKVGKKAALAYSEDECQTLRNLMRGQAKLGSGKRPDWDYVAKQLQVHHPMKLGYPVRTGDSVQTRWWRRKGGDPKRASKNRKLAQAAPDSSGPPADEEQAEAGSGDVLLSHDKHIISPSPPDQSEGIGNPNLVYLAQRLNLSLPTDRTLNQIVASIYTSASSHHRPTSGLDLEILRKGLISRRPHLESENLSQTTRLDDRTSTTSQLPRQFRSTKYEAQDATTSGPHMGKQ